MLQIEDYPRGVEALELSTRADATIPWFRNSLADGYMCLAQVSAPMETEKLLDKAIAEATAATNLESSDVSWQVTLAEALFQRSRTDAAAAEFNRARKDAVNRASVEAAGNDGWAAYRLALLKVPLQIAILALTG